MSTFGFFLGLALTGATLASLAALVVVTLAPLAALARLDSARRADLLVFCGLLPAVVGVVGMGLTALPALLALAGVSADHCLQHNHHGHLCPVHLTALPPWMASCGGIVAAVAVARVARLLVAQQQQRRLLRAAALIGARSCLDDGTPLVVIDGPPTLLHAGHEFIVASRALLERLHPRSCRAALAHEAAHVRRDDSRWLMRLAVAGALAPPGFGGWLLRRYRQAAEEAADEAAAVVVGVVDVAAAVVDVSRLRQRSALEGLPALDGANLERRIRRLLTLTPRPRRSGAAVVVGVLLAATLAAVPFFDDIHHLAETALAQVERARHVPTT